LLSCGLPNDTPARLAPPADAEGIDLMAATLRLLLLALVLAYTLVVEPSSALADRVTAQRKTVRLRVHRRPWFGLQTAAPTPLGERAVTYAKRFLGAPYRWGGTSPGGFDCSGLVRYVYQRFGVELPHSSYADFSLGRRVGRWALQPGDLVFFSGLGHVGLYVGHGRFIHAPHSGTRVEISSLREYAGSYDGARRVVAGATRRLLHG
jgi:cell wall-associated NlpC family hydrolase